MAAAKVEAMWDMDGRDHPVLVVEKKRGKLNLAEVEDLLRYSKKRSISGKLCADHPGRRGNMRRIRLDG